MQIVAEPVLNPGEVLVHVQAAAVHPLVRFIAGGKHYASPKHLPQVLGVDGVGTTAAGEKVYFGPLNPPFCGIAERVAVPRALLAPVPAEADPVHVASLINPGMAALLPLSWRARLAAGQSVCILGATGAAGSIAVRLARALGAGRVVAVGRRRSVLDALCRHGATDTIALEDGGDWEAAFADKGGPDGFDVVLDYLYGSPAQALINTIAKRKYAKEIRFVHVGEMAGPAVQVTGAVLRSTGLHIMGFGLRSGGGWAARDVELDAIAKLIRYAGEGTVQVAGRPTPIEALEASWNQADPRIVVTF